MNSASQIQQQEKTVTVIAKKEMYGRLMTVAQLLLKSINAQGTNSNLQEEDEKTRE